MTHISSPGIRTNYSSGALELLGFRPGSFGGIVGFISPTLLRVSQEISASLSAMEDQKNRPHRTPKEKKKHTGGKLLHQPFLTLLPLTTLADRNPKAFAYARPGRLAKQAVRSHDVPRSRLDHSRSLLKPSPRSKKNASMSLRSTACPSTHRPKLSPLSGLQAWGKQLSSSPSSNVTQNRPSPPPPAPSQSSHQSEKD